MIKKNILFITNFSHNCVGGIEMYNKLIFEDIKDFNFYEIPILWSDKKTKYPNPKTMNTKIIDEFKMYDYFLMDKVNIPSILYNNPNKAIRTISRYWNKNINCKTLSKFFEGFIKENNINKIVVSSSYFFNKKFFKKYQKIIYFVQHQTPFFYFENYLLDKKTNSIQKNNWFLKKLYIFLGVKYPFLRIVKNLIVFDEINEKNIVKKYKDIDNIYKIPIASKFKSIVSKNLQIMKYDFIIPIRIELQKNIDAIADFAKANKGLKIVICGEGILKHKLVNISNIKLANACNDIQLLDYFKKSKFLILFSFFEGFPLAIVEAMSQGLPCIVANTFPSAEFLVGDNERGFLFDLNDPDYNEKILNYINSIDYSSVSKKCIDFANEKLTQKQFIDNWRKLLES